MQEATMLLFVSVEAEVIEELSSGFLEFALPVPLLDQCWINAGSVL
jgi:hypothetical protein